jgi:hypothetical protein
MIDVFWYFLSTLTTMCIIVALFVFYRLIIGDRYLQSANKLKSQMANLRRDFPELSENKEEFVGKSISGLGVEGIIDSLIPKQYKAFAPIIKPIATGFIESYLKDPAKLQALASKLGVKLPDGTQNSGFASQM